MFTQKIVPSGNSVTIRLPDSFISKKVKLIAIVEREEKSFLKKKSIEDLKKELRGLTVSMKGYKFNRDEANDYD